jgi:MFS family permease
MKPARTWWGSNGHIAFTIVVFVVLASLDNAAIALLPNMVLPISEELGTSEGAIGAITAVVILVTALTAVGWGYWGDRSSRKRLLLYGTGIWAAGAAASATSTGFWYLLLWQAVTALGLGSIASVGFSVISDFVRPKRRGLAMSFWGLSQGIGGLTGGLLASQLGAEDFRRPLIAIAILGGIFGLLYMVTFDPPRGFREPELEDLHNAGEKYEHHIDRDQIPLLFKTRTNRWLVLQGLTAQVAYGSLIWVPLLYQEKVIDAGYSTATGTKVGGIFVALFQIGGLFSILAGHLGDKWQARDPAGRAKLSSIGILGAIPFFVGFFFVPLRGLDVDPDGSTLALVGDVFVALFTNPWAAGAFVLALGAGALTGADSPNKFALISDVNVPEHRGTVFGVADLASGIGRSSGTGLTGLLAGTIETALPPPLNFAVGLASFQAFFLPTGYFYWRAIHSAPGDIARTRNTLSDRARAASDARIPPADA